VLDDWLAPPRLLEELVLLLLAVFLQHYQGHDMVSCMVPDAGILEVPMSTRCQQLWRR
jgi:hypothetical protein